MTDELIMWLIVLTAPALYICNFVYLSILKHNMHLSNLTVFTVIHISCLLVENTTSFGSRPCYQFWWLLPILVTATRGPPFNTLTRPLADIVWHHMMSAMSLWSVQNTNYRSLSDLEMRLSQKLWFLIWWICFLL